ncbi:hypothetical protein [Nocardia paucivorans]|uniref:hypothetical protein n=1 Tax=Nocardia paucivorans TaxID=114259 RepID=UPI000311CA71|nr:hypothetical protein [Nocardia paucivorans]
MAEEEGQLKYWQNLRTQAENGELRMDKDLGEALARECHTLIGKLELMLEQAGDLQYVSGFGGLASAQALAGKFSRKAFGDEDSAVKRLEESIEIVKTMKATYELAIRQLDTTDQEIATQLGRTAPQ